MPCGGRGQHGPRPPPPGMGLPPLPRAGHLGVQRPLLDLTDALLDDEGHAVGRAAGRRAEVLAEELQAALQPLVAALDGQRLQTLLVAGQAALGRAGGSCVSDPSSPQRPPGPHPLKPFPEVWSLVAHPPLGGGRGMRLCLTPRYSSAGLAVLPLGLCTAGDLCPGPIRSPAAPLHSPLSGPYQAPAPSPPSSTHLLALSALEVDVAVALPALGWCAQLPQPVRSRCLGQAHMAEGPAGHGHWQLGAHAIEVGCRVERAVSLPKAGEGQARLPDSHPRPCLGLSPLTLLEGRPPCSAVWLHQLLGGRHGAARRHPLQLHKVP